NNAHFQPPSCSKPPTMLELASRSGRTQRHGRGIQRLDPLGVFVGGVIALTWDGCSSSYHSEACYLSGRKHGRSVSETTRVHDTAQWRGCNVAACGKRGAAGDVLGAFEPSDWVFPVAHSANCCVPPTSIWSLSLASLLGRLTSILPSLGRED